MAGVTYPALAAAAIIDPQQLNQNFQDAINATRGLTTANLAAAAGLVSSQIADRFSEFSIGPIELVPFTSGADLNAPANYNVPDTTVAPGTEIKRIYLPLRTGRSAYLIGAVFRAAAEAQVGGADVAAWLTVSGTVIGGGPATIVAAADVKLLNPNPLDTPMRGVGNGDYISIGLGRTNAGGRPTCRGLYCTLFFKAELGA